MFIFLLILLPFISILSALLEAFMDIYSHEKWEKSVYVQIDKWFKVKFKNTKYFKYFFDQLMWKNKYVNRYPENPIRRVWSFKLHPAFTDFWHFSKSFIAMLNMTQVIISCWLILQPELNLLLIAILTVGCGIIRNIAFNQFYHKTLISGD